MSVIKTLPHKHLLIFCLAAAFPLVLMALLFHLPLSTHNRLYLPGTSGTVLGDVIHSAFLAAACGIVPLIPLLFTASNRAWSTVLKLVFAVLGFACMWVARTLAGTGGMLFFVLLVFVTYGGGTLFVFDWLFGATRTFLTLLRWSVTLFSYVTLQLQFDLDIDITHWKHGSDAIRFGAAYFYLLALLEVAVYPPLTWYLEYRLRGEQRYSVALDGFGQTQQWD